MTFTQLSLQPQTSISRAPTQLSSFSSYSRHQHPLFAFEFSTITPWNNALPRPGKFEIP
ncbi:hypothetical protein CF319_g9616, partial [Tilletia indica]